ncbi:MAG: hypothetical protein RMJ85_15680 [Anaerolineales bacterium]|nr:hypothetical protein [Anaerolineales bacterium]
MISANAEWQAVKTLLQPEELEKSPFGEFFLYQGVIYFHGGWGKIAAAASTQYALDQFVPNLLVNLGTCGGFSGYIERGTILLVTKTLVYDILEQMSDPQEAIEHYSTTLDLSWLPDSVWRMVNHHSVHGSSAVVPGLLLSADRDIVSEDIPVLVKKYNAIAADWESGAIAWVTKRNQVRCMILRGVTDLVGLSGGEAYGNPPLFHENTRKVMKTLLNLFELWLPYLVKGDSR